MTKSTAHSIAIKDVDGVATELEVRVDPICAVGVPNSSYFLQFRTSEDYANTKWVDLNLPQTKQLIAFLQAQVDTMELPVLHEEPAQVTPNYATLSDQAKTVWQHMKRTGSISAREAFADHGITSATLARRVCDIEENGYKIERERRVHPLSGRRYTRYKLVG